MFEKQDSFIGYLQKKKWLLWMLILMITLLWGYAWVIMKAVLEYMGPFTFSSLRFGVGAITLFLIVWIVKMEAPPKRYQKHLIVVGLLQTAVVYLFVMFALNFVGAGKSSVLLFSMPMWSSILAMKFLGEKLTAPKIIGLLLGFIGLLTILGWDIWVGQPFTVIIGELLIIVAAFSWAVSNVYYRKFVQDLPQIQVSAYQMLYGAIGITLATLFMEWGEPIVFNWTSVYYILFTGILTSALCFTVWFIIMSVVDMVAATISIMLVPVFGLLFSSILLDERLTTSIMIGSLLIIIGIVLAQKKTQQAEVKNELLKKQV